MFVGLGCWSSEERRVEGGGGGLDDWMALYYGIPLSLQKTQH